MPWCETCSRYLTPSAMNPDGGCPSCGTVAEVHGVNGAPRRVTAQNLDLHALAGERERVPWHFTLLVVMLVAYIGWRIVSIFV